MKKGHSLKEYWTLFITFLKVGLFTFGGGYAMIPIIHKEVVEKNHWLKNDDILDILAISESTPGPISVNTATFVGYRVAGFFGSLFATLGLILPSFVIIFIISLFYETFLSWKLVNAAFKGIRVGVIILLFRAVIKLSKGTEISKKTTIPFGIVLITVLLTTIFDLKIFIGTFQLSISLIFIVLGMIYGIVVTRITEGGKK